MAGTISRGVPVQHNYVYIKIHVGIHVGIERERLGVETRGRRLSKGSEVERESEGERVPLTALISSQICIFWNKLSSQRLINADNTLTMTDSSTSMIRTSFQLLKS